MKAASLLKCVIACAAALFCGAAFAADTVSLSVNGAEKPVELRALTIEGSVAGRLAWTTMEMTFYNPNSRVLEGELQFPLRDGQTVTGFALEMETGDKKRAMREAVPVEKAKGRQTFEEITRRRVDPALLEVTQGNNFKLRVYPLNPGQTRRVRVTYTERLPDDASSPGAVLYKLPLAYPDTIEIFRLSVKMNVRTIPAESAANPEDPEKTPPSPMIKSSSLPVSLSLGYKPGGNTFFLDGSSFRERVEGELELSIPAGGGAFTGERDGVTYFYAEVPVDPMPAPAADKAAPLRAAVLWDASASGRGRDHDKEFAFLDAFFAGTGSAAVTLRVARDTAEPASEFQVKDGDWTALRAALESVVYDGATNLSALLTEGAQDAPGAPEDAQNSPDMFLLFSDGLDNYSGTPTPAPARPLFAFISAPGSDAARLKGLASRSGGRLVDLTLLDAKAALAEVKSETVRVLSVEGGVSDVVWGPVSNSGTSLAVAGIVKDPSIPIRMTLAGARGIVLAIEGLASAPRSERVPSVWASMKLERLEEEYDLNRGEIRRLGKAFGIATRETSLIVLDTVQDYVRYDIEPPAELKEEYDRVRASAGIRNNSPASGKLERVLAQWRLYQEWWKTEFPKEGKGPKPKRDLEPSEMQARTQINTWLGNRMLELGIASPRVPLEYEYGAGMADDNRLPRAVPQSPQQPAAGGRPDEMRSLAYSVAAPEESASPSAPAVTVALRPWTPDAPYIRRMEEAKDEDLYRVYLDERPDWENSTAFFLDAADQLKKRGLEALALRVLSNLAEINLENRQILRVLGYRLMEAGKAEQAAVIFAKVLNLGEEEPQSYRDLGLAQAAAGEPQKAIDNLYRVVEKDFPRAFPGIEVIALTEINGIIAAASDSQKPLDTSRVDPRFLTPMPVDIRAVLTWDAGNTDIDLHVIDPNGEETYYESPLSWQGGRVSPDNTAGYGPEEFVLRNPKPGIYRVEVNFYGHNEQIISGATAVQLDFFTFYGTPRQQKQSVTMRLRGRNDRIVIGEFEAKAEFKGEFKRHNP